jgi:hypothetical protein
MQQNPYAAPTAGFSQQHGHVNLDGPRDWTIGEVLNVGWTAVWKNPGVLIGGAFVIAFIQQAMSYGINAALPPVEQTDPMAVLMRSLITMPVTLLIGTFFTIGNVRVALAAARDEPVEFGMFFSGMDRLIPGYIALLITYVGAVIGTLFLIVPGIILLLGWSLVFVLTADTQLSVMDMLKESWGATKGQKGRLFLFGFVACGVAILGVLALVVGIFVAIPMLMIAFAEIYMCITGRRQSAS